ncbi:hypothetical protein BDW22DRAFT_1347382 [Trametopsis cervina]|nr:hypothetical protein BDW22DRAFT_1347382 [Trametopsis cervina]
MSLTLYGELYHPSPRAFLRLVDLQRQMNPHHNTSKGHEGCPATVICVIAFDGIALPWQYATSCRVYVVHSITMCNPNGHRQGEYESYDDCNDLSLSPGCICPNFLSGSIFNSEACAVYISSEFLITSHVLSTGTHIFLRCRKFSAAFHEADRWRIIYSGQMRRTCKVAASRYTFQLRANGTPARASIGVLSVVKDRKNADDLSSTARSRRKYFNRNASPKVEFGPPYTANTPLVQFPIAKLRGAV